MVEILYSGEKCSMSDLDINIPDKRGLKALKGFQLMSLFGIFLIGLILTGVASVGFQSIPGMGERTSLLLSAAVQCVLAFCVPAWLTGKFTTHNAAQWLSLKTTPHAKAFVGVIIVYVIALPAINQIISWNESIHFPESLQWLENSLRASEEAAQGVSDKILASMNLWTMLAAIMVVGLLTGFSEEIFFRGALQNILTMPGRYAFAVWSSAIVFSAIHFQFFGFVPRLLMGVFFGYLLVWTGSLWVPVFAHAFNNSVVVLSVWLSSYGSAIDLEILGTSTAGSIPWDALTSGVATFLFFWKFRKYFFFKTVNKD